MTNNSIEIDKDLCTGCGLCTTVCPTETISLTEGKAAVTGIDSISCGHCEAVCPQGAIRVAAIDREMSIFKTFTVEKQWLPQSRYKTSELVQLMSSRRSCRSFASRPIDREILEDLVKIGVAAPSGTNSQRWTFTILPTRRSVTSLAVQIASFFGRLNAAAEKTMLRLFLKLIGKGELDTYYRAYYEKIRSALEEWHGSGKDRLFHGSTAAIIVGSRPGAGCPMEDALLATQNILLAAHSMGLSSCLVGYAVAAMKKDRSIQKSIGIPSEEDIHAVIALGYSDEVYQYAAGRKQVIPRYFEG